MQYPRYQGLDPDDDGDDDSEFDDRNDDPGYDMEDLEEDFFDPREADFLYDPLRDRIGEFE